MTKQKITLSPFTSEEYHRFFRGYVPDPLMTFVPFKYDYEQLSNSYRYNYGGYQKGYVHFGIYLNDVPVGSFQLKRINQETGTCEFGIILQNERYKNRGIGTEAVRMGLEIARDHYQMHTVYGDTTGRNVRMQRVFRKLDFRLCETIENAFELPDGRCDARLVWKKEL